MAQSDVFDDLADAVRRVLNVGPKAIPSAAPGGGPEADRENNRVLGHPIGSRRTRGHDAEGFGGHGDAVLLDDQVSAEVRRAIDEHVRLAQRRGLREPRPSHRIRFNRPFSPEAHIEDHSEDVLGPMSFFSGTSTAPGAGNSTQIIPVTMATGTISPVELLNRYPGALFFNLRVSSFSWVPTGTAMTGLQSIVFQDIGQAVCPLGVYATSSQTVGAYVGIDKLLTTPYTDPGVITLGNIVVTNIGIGGTPVGSAWQLGICYECMVPDPYYNEQMVIPPTPAEIAEAIATTAGAGGQ